MKIFAILVFFLGMIGLNNESANAQSLEAWTELAIFKPDRKTLINARSGRNHAEKTFDVQRIKDGTGRAVNFDEYIVEIVKFPKGQDKNKFFEYIRINLNDFLDQNNSKLKPFSNGDKVDWGKGQAALLGTIMLFEISLPVGSDTGAVVVSKAGEFSWVFSPIKDAILTGNFGTHPVAGNREFGIRENNAGKFEFYTRAVDRVYPTEVSFFEGKAFEGADKLWKSLQTNLKKYVDENGGEAKIKDAIVPGGNDAKHKPQYSAVCADQNINIACK